jgi:hypothetical protein
MSTMAKVALWVAGIPMPGLGVISFMLASSDEGLGTVVLGAAAVAFVGFVMCLVALIATLSDLFHPRRREHSKASEEDVCPPGNHLSPSCGCREADGSKTCRWCGADQEWAERRWQS